MKVTWYFPIEKGYEKTLPDLLAHYTKELLWEFRLGFAQHLADEFGLRVNPATLEVGLVSDHEASELGPVPRWRLAVSALQVELETVAS